MATRLARVTARTAAEVCQAMELPPEDAALLRPEAAPGDFLDALVAAGRLDTAVRFLAHAIPHREATWWACVVARANFRQDAPPGAAEALRAAEAWVYKPTEEYRWAAHDYAQATNLDPPAAWAAMAAYFAGPSLTRPLNLPPGYPPVPPVPPKPFLTARAAANAIVLACDRDDPAQTAAELRRSLARGVEIANQAGGA